MNIENQQFEIWRKEQIASLIRMGYPDAAKAFRDLGSVHWAGWQAAWGASRAVIEIELPKKYESDYGAGVYQDDEGDLYLIEDVVRSIESIGLKVKS